MWLAPDDKKLTTGDLDEKHRTLNFFPALPFNSKAILSNSFCVKHDKSVSINNEERLR